jgi:hypothetical protein
MEVGMSEQLIELPNGAAVFVEPKLHKWAVAAPSGEIVAYKREKAAALALAAQLTGEKLPVPERRLVQVSPRADPSLRGREV